MINRLIKFPSQNYLTNNNFIYTLSDQSIVSFCNFCITIIIVKFIGLDKITAKTSDIIIKLGETKKFGPLEIKVLKCGRTQLENKNNHSVAYLQVKDTSKNENEKVFIFNGWTFSSDPTLAPFDHAIYDLQLVGCDNV